MAIAGVEGRHAYYPPGASVPAFTLGLEKTDAAVPIYPRVTLHAVNLSGLGDPQDASDAIIGAHGEVARPAFRRGHTVTYSGFVEARSLADFRTFEDTLKAGMADQSEPGRIIASWHPLRSLGTAKWFPARAMGLEIGDPLEARSVYRATLVAAFRNHDGRHFEQLESSVVRTIPLTGNNYAWPTVVLPATMRGPVLDVVSNWCTNPSGAGLVTTGWVSTGTITTFDAVNLLTSSYFDPIFDPPTDTALHVVTPGGAGSGAGARFDRAVTSGSAVRFVAWVRNRSSSAQPIQLQIRDAGGVTKATSATSAAADSTWTRLEVTVTPDSTGVWQFRVQQSGAGACEWAFGNVRITTAQGLTIEPGFGPRINLPVTWDAPDLHFDFEDLSILDDAGHDWSAIINPAFGTWARNPFPPGSNPKSASTSITGPQIDPGVTLTLRWVPAYW